MRSTKLEASVIGIASTGTDVQNLISDGYNITSIKPIIMSRVEANGNDSTKAGEAIVTLLKEDAGKASVMVDLTEGKVTRIVMTTKTVIDKS